MPAPVLDDPGVKIPTAHIEQHGSLIDDLATLGVKDVVALLRELDPDDGQGSRDVLLKAVPEIADPLVSAATMAGATFYEETRELARVSSRFSPQLLVPTEPERYESLVRWAVKPWFQTAAESTVEMLLSGGLQKLIANGSRDTVIGNAERDDVLVGYQRSPAAGCCAFCGMVASNGHLFQNPEDAERVIGRGVPVEQTQGKRGGQGRGLRPRERGGRTRGIGEKYHDWCRCRGVPVFKSTYVEMQAGTEKYYEAYVDAQTKVSSGLELDGWLDEQTGRFQFQWVDAKEGAVSPEKKTKMILAAMRAELGTA